MDGMLVLLGGYVILILLTAPVGFTMILGLRRRVAMLESQIAAAHGGAAAIETSPRPAAAVAEPPADSSAPIPWRAMPPSSDEPSVEAPPQAVVFTTARGAALTAWLTENWFLAVAGVSLALAGVFLVQYGVENGLLTPPLRVCAALALGTGLLLWAERMRRRLDDDRGAGAHIPSTFAAGGVITLYAAVWGAFGLYGLIGPGLAFAAMAAVGAAAIGFGWAYGPFLAALGAAGATLAPFLIGGGSGAAQYLPPYFLIVAVAALAVDAYKRWAWLSALGLALGFGAMTATFLSVGGPLIYLPSAFGLLLAAVMLPPLRTRPAHTGATMLGGRPGHWPEFPTRIAFGGLCAASLAAILALLNDGGATGFWLALAMVMLVMLAATLWMAQAPALSDGAIAPAAALLAVAALGSGAMGHNPEAADLLSDPRACGVLALMAASLGVAALAHWRSLRGAAHSLRWAGAAAASAPLMAALLEWLWRPSHVLTAEGWALTLMLGAAVMTLVAQRYAARDTQNRLPIAMAAIAAVDLIAFALFMALSKTALTLSLGLLTALTAWLASRYRLPHAARMAMLGAAVVGFRLLGNPGLDWALTAPAFDMTLGFVGSAAFMAAAWAATRPEAHEPRAVFYSACAATLASFLCIALLRAFGDPYAQSHWRSGLLAGVWFIAALAQGVRVPAGGPMVTLRAALAAGFAAIGGGFLLHGALVANPLFAWDEPVIGPAVVNSLLASYGLPAALLLAMAARLTFWPDALRRALRAIGGATLALTAGLLIRHAWQGPILTGDSLPDGELYSYTAAMLIASAALLTVSLSPRGVGLRRLALALAGATAAKAFLIDAAALSGLLRVAAFLALGLTLAGLAWLNRRFAPPPTEP